MACNVFCPLIPGLAIRTSASVAPAHFKDVFAVVLRVRENAEFIVASDDVQMF